MHGPEGVDEAVALGPMCVPESHIEPLGLLSSEYTARSRSFSSTSQERAPKARVELILACSEGLASGQIAG